MLSTRALGTHALLSPSFVFSPFLSATVGPTFDRYEIDDVSKVTLSAWPGQGYGRHWLSSGLLVQFVSFPYSDVFDLLYDSDLRVVYLYS